MSKKETEVISLLKKPDYMTIDCLLIFISSNTYLVIDLKFNNPFLLENFNWSRFQWKEMYSV